MITGEAPLAEMQQKLTDIVTGISKVTHVYNEVTVAAPSSMVSRSSDTYITTKVKTQLFNVNNDIKTIIFKKFFIYLSI